MFRKSNQEEDGPIRKAIFWDFDGTLTDGEPSWRFCLATALGPLAGRYGITEDSLRPYLKSGFPWHPDGNQRLTGDAFWQELFRLFAGVFVQLGVPKDQAAEAARRVRSVALDPGRYRVRPDAAATLALCAYKGWRNYILSNNFPELEQILKALHLRQFFSGLVVSGVVGACKPDVKIFRLAERAARFPSLIWMVGDNPVADIRGAQEAGWRTVYVARPGAVHCGAEVTVSRLEQALPYF